MAACSFSDSAKCLSLNWSPNHFLLLLFLLLKLHDIVAPVQAGIEALFSLLIIFNVPNGFTERSERAAVKKKKKENLLWATDIPASKIARILHGYLYKRANQPVPTYAMLLYWRLD